MLMVLYSIAYCIFKNFNSREVRVSHNLHSFLAQLRVQGSCTNIDTVRTLTRCYADSIPVPYPILHQASLHWVVLGCNEVRSTSFRHYVVAGISSVSSPDYPCRQSQLNIAFSLSLPENTPRPCYRRLALPSLSFANGTVGQSIQRQGHIIRLFSKLLGLLEEVLGFLEAL